MADKVHPRGDSPVHRQPSYTTRTASLSDHSSDSSPLRPPAQKPATLGDSPNHRQTATGRTLSSSGSFEASTGGQKTAAPQPPPPGNYVVQLPKEQIFSYSRPENEKKYQKLSATKPRRSCCRLCLCYTLGILLLLILAVGTAAGVLYLVFRPDAPDYTVSEIAIRGINLTSSAPISPEFDVSIRAENDNRKLGIYYQPGSKINVLYGDVLLSNGALPLFYQPSKNITLLQTALKGSNVVLSDSVRSKLGTEQRQGNVPFTLNVEAPVKIKVGAVRSWKITVKVKCDVTVDSVNNNSGIIYRNCDYRVKLW